jgi:hypothetical protein
MLGVALVPTAGFSWLFVLPVQLQDRTNNPYAVWMSGMAHQFLLQLERSPCLVQKTPEGVAECVPTDAAYAAADGCG